MGEEGTLLKREVLGSIRNISRGSEVVSSSLFVTFFGSWFRSTTDCLGRRESSGFLV